MPELVFFCMIAGILAALAVFCYVVLGIIVVELFRKKYDDVGYKDALIALFLAVVLTLFSLIMVWTTVDAQKAEVQCDLKGGIVNEHNDCVLEIEL